MNVGQIRGSVNEIQKSLSSISLPQNLTTKFSTIIGNLSKELDNFGIHRMYLNSMWKKGLVEKVAHGIYIDVNKIEDN